LRQAYDYWQDQPGISNSISNSIHSTSGFEASNCAAPTSTDESETELTSPPDASATRTRRSPPLAFANKAALARRLVSNRLETRRSRPTHTLSSSSIDQFSLSMNRVPVWPRAFARSSNFGELRLDVSSPAEAGESRLDGRQRLLAEPYQSGPHSQSESALGLQESTVRSSQSAVNTEYRLSRSSRLTFSRQFELSLVRRRTFASVFLSLSHRPNAYFRA
jgi:hypothetical protein